MCTPDVNAQKYFSKPATAVKRKKHKEVETRHIKASKKIGSFSILKLLSFVPSNSKYLLSEHGCAQSERGFRIPHQKKCKVVCPFNLPIFSTEQGGIESEIVLLSVYLKKRKVCISLYFYAGGTDHRLY